MRILCGYKYLIDHLENNYLSASYKDPVIQNNFIEIRGNVLQEQIVGQINKLKCFSVLVDETTDIPCFEQFSLCTRYLDVENGELKEDFF